MGKNLKRALALLIAVVMIIAMIPTIAFAEDAETSSQLEDGRGLGKKVPDRYVSTRNITPKTSTPKTALPASYNSNTLGYITPIRNQGSYGTCWAHGAIASCEAYMIKHGVKVGTGSAATTSLNLSESHLAWFGYSDAYDALGMLAGDKTKAASDYRDLGGFGEIPTYTLMRWEGLASESTSGLSYSSMPKNGLSSSLAYQVNVAHVQDCVWIPTSDRTAVKEAIMEYGAGTFGYYADDNYEQNDGSYYYPSNESSNHDVTVVGWDDNYSKSKFSPQPSGNGAWIIKNSWGTSYGTNGYYYISYYDVPSSNDTCYFYKVENVDNYDNNYQYDGTTNFNNYMQLKRNGSVANVFTANGTETLEAVAFCNWDAGMSYKCDIYKNPTGSNPTSGTLVSTKSGTFEYAGYHTVELDTTVSLSAGDRFSVVFTNTGSSTIDIGLDQTGSSSGWVSWTHSSPSGASFYTNSGSWTDYSGTANLRIKAYTKNGTVVQDPCTITLKAGTSTWRTVDTTTYTSATLPNYTGTVPSGYTFAGWTTAAISGTTQTAPTLYNGSYSTNDATAITLYACFSKSEGSGGSGNRYTLTSSLTSGNDYIFVSSNTAGNAYALDAANMVGSPTHTTEPTAVTVSSGATPYVDLAADSTLPFHVTTDGSMGSYTKYKMTATVNGEERYLTINGNGIGYQSGYKAGWDNSNGLFGTNSKNTTCYYAYYADGNFDASSSASGRVYAYEKSGASGTTVYTTTITVCSHTYQETDRLDATCTEEGTIEYTCSKCGDRYYDDIPALGHSYGAFTSNSNGTHSKICSRCSDKVTEDCSYTSTTSGTITTYTCSVCNYSYQATKDTYTVTFRVPGFESDIAPASVIEGNSITLPTVGTVDGYTFAGWTTAAIDPESTTAPTVLTGSYKPTANVTLYALYTRTEAGTGTGSSDEFTKVTSAPSDWSGDYLIVWEAGNNDARVFNGESGTEKFATGTISGNKITKSDDYAVVSIEKMTGGYSLYVDGKGYMKGTSGSNALSYATSAQLNTIEMDDDGVLITSNTSVLRWNNATSSGHMFRYYKSTSYAAQQPIQLYKKGAGGSSSTTYYTTNPVAAVPCAHNNMETVAAAAATCEIAGNNAYYHCPDCGKYFKDAAGSTETTVAAETIAALGHNYSTTATQLDATNHKYVCSRCDAYTTEAHSFTETTEGATVTHLCSACGYSYETTLNTYTVTYCVPGFESVIAPVSVIEGNSVTLPTAGTVDGYIFAGWTTAAIDPESTTAPTVLTGSYKPTANVTLYALYTRTEAGEGGAAGYYLATETPAVGDEIIIAIKNGNDWYALPNGNTSGVYSITGDELTVTNGRAVDTEDNTFVVAENKGYTGIKSTTGDYYLALNSGKLAMNGWGDTKPIAFTAGTESGTYYIVGAKSGTSGNEGRALDYSGSVFSCDGEDGGSPVYIFAYTEGGTGDTTYYTTNPTISTECQHLHTSVIGASEPTCQFDGYTGDTFCNDCYETIQTGTVIPKLGHDIVIDAAVPATCTESGLTEGQHCTRCEYATVNQNVIPALGHEYNAEGICYECGDKLIDIVSASLRLDEDIDVIFTAKVPEGATASMTFTMNGESVTVSDNGTHTFAFEGVNPQCMGDNINAVLTVTYNGVTYACNKETYSVRQYCVNKLADSSVTGTLRTLISDVLAYGAAAQTYMSYNTSALVNSGSDVKNPTYSTFTSLSGLGASFAGAAANDVCWIGSGLTLTNNVAMNFRFYAESVNGLSVNVTVNGRTKAFTASDFIAVDGKANTYEISFKGIKANEFADNVTASFARNGAQIGNTVSYSVNAYICAKQADSDANLAALVKALYNYGTAAKAYNPI